MEIQAQALLRWIFDHILQLLAIVSLFVEVVPVKWNPVTSFFIWISKLLTKNLSEQMKDMTEELESIRTEQDTNEKDRIRWEILDFANSCRNGRKHSRDEFQHIIALNDKYRELLKKTNDKNGVFEAEYDWIMNIYRERLDKNDFLQ